MQCTPALIQALAEAFSPYALELSAGLLQRPIPGNNPLVDAATLFTDLTQLHNEAIPALESTFSELAEVDIDEIEELTDELTAPALDCIAMAHEIWQATLTDKEESARPLLASLAEAPATQLLHLMQLCMQAALNPWAVFDDPDTPSFPFEQSFACFKELQQLQQWQHQQPRSNQPFQF